MQESFYTEETKTVCQGTEIGQGLSTWVGGTGETNSINTKVETHQ